MKPFKDRVLFTTSVNNLRKGKTERVGTWIHVKTERRHSLIGTCNPVINLETYPLLGSSIKTIFLTFRLSRTYLSGNKGRMVDVEYPVHEILHRESGLFVRLSPESNRHPLPSIFLHLPPYKGTTRCPNQDLTKRIYKIWNHFHISVINQWGEGFGNNVLFIQFPHLFQYLSSIDPIRVFGTSFLVDGDKGQTSLLVFQWKSCCQYPIMIWEIENIGKTHMSQRRRYSGTLHDQGL